MNDISLFDVDVKKGRSYENEVIIVLNKYLPKELGKPYICVIKHKVSKRKNIDAYIITDKNKYPLEIKSCNYNNNNMLFELISTFDDDKNIITSFGKFDIYSKNHKLAISIINKLVKNNSYSNYGLLISDISDKHFTFYNKRKKGYGYLIKTKYLQDVYADSYRYREIVITKTKGTFGKQWITISSIIKENDFIDKEWVRKIKW